MERLSMRSPAWSSQSARKEPQTFFRRFPKNSVKGSTVRIYKSVGLGFLREGLVLGAWGFALNPEPDSAMFKVAGMKLSWHSKR